MESFVLKTVKKLRKETPRRFQDLRNVCDDLIALVGESDTDISDTPSKFADKYLEPFRLACESRQSRLVEIGLEGVHYLLEHGYFRKSTEVDRSGLLDSVVEMIGKCAEDFDEVVQVQVIKTFLTAVTSGQCELHEEQLLTAVRSCFHIHLLSKYAVSKTTAKAALTQMLTAVNQRMEAYEMNNDSRTVVSEEPATPSEVEEDSANNSGDIPDSAVFPSIFHKDSYRIFVALCKLSMKGSDDTGTTTDVISLQNRILSLELIQHILQHSGPAFKSGERFIYAVKNFLCVSLLSNCTSQNAQITGLSLQIFILLMEHFKDHLKSELEVFITGIFLRLLESENSSFEHKLRVLEVFHSICRDSSALVEIFINYDCDMEAIDLFRRIVDGFAKIAKHPGSTTIRTSDFMSSAGKKAIQDELQVRGMGLEGLVIILQSMLKSAGLLKVEESESSTSEQLREQTRSFPRMSPVMSRQESSTVNFSDVIDEETSTEQVSANSANEVDVFDRKQKIQEEIETGILKFNLSPKKGLAYLANLGHLELSPQSVAKFLLQYQDRLDKTAVGDYLGKEREYENGFCLKVLHEYVDSMNFAGVAFDLAIRHFLAGFRLPGEAQKIDRIMEKFAERYFLQNRDVFASADMAFILAFSTIMLQTNLHNPAIRDDKRMTKEQFVKQNKGISSDGEIPDDMLMDIYDRIAAQPITINQDEKSLKKSRKDESSFFQQSADRRRKDAFSNERKEMVRAGQAMIKQRRQSTYVRKKERSEDTYYVRPMFDVVWAPILGVLSQVLENTDDSAAVSSCLHGFQHAIRLACRLDVPIARDTYINALAKFTNLDSVREMHPKNVECIKSLLLVALSEKEFIDESWTQIVQCISHLARLQLFAAGAHTDDMFFADPSDSNGKSRKSSAGRSNGQNMALDFTKFFTGPSRAEVARIVEEGNADLIMKEISPAVIDQIFLNSQLLSEQSVLHFVRSLCIVSALEINISSTMNSVRNREAPEATTPRVFCLQKLVEVADFNMQCRPRIAWANMWKLLAEHFATVGMIDNPPLAMFAVDSLKQLSIKFLQKEELSNFNFQRLFLKPFEMIISNSKSSEIKDLVLRCLDIMILACATNIRSGWRSIFLIFEVAARQEVTEVAAIAFNVIERLMEKSFDLLIYDFVELMNCLVVFVASRHTDLSLSALRYLSLCADKLAEGKLSTVVSHQNTSNDTMHISWEKSHRSPNEKVGPSDEDLSVFRLWWPLLLGLSTQVSDPRLQVRLKALETLQSSLLSYGNTFSPQAWGVIFRGVLFPMLESAKTDTTQQPISAFPSENPPGSSNRNSWIATMGQPVLNFCEQLYFKFRPKSEEANLLCDLLVVLENCICQDNEALAKMGLRTFHDLLLRIGNDSFPLSQESLDLICKRLCSCLNNNFTRDFGEIGYLEFIQETPKSIREASDECPLAKRRRNRDASKNAEEAEGQGDEVYHTPYGEGKKVEELPRDERLGLPDRHCLDLTWGKLYCQAGSDSAKSDHSAYSREYSEIPWEQIAVPVMTTMVIALESIRVVSDVAPLFFTRFQLSQINDILLALETLYWHARSFNASQKLRGALYGREFMRFSDDSGRLPHLLEQEVFSLSKILEIILQLHTKCEVDTLRSFSQAWVHRVVLMTGDRYVSIEKHLEESIESYDHEEHEAYGTAILIALHGVNDMNSQQFKIFFPIFSQTLSKLVLCEDLDVRSCVSEIYSKQVNTLLLSLLQI